MTGRNWPLGVCVLGLALMAHAALAQTVQEVAKGAEKNMGLVQNIRAVVATTLNRYDRIDTDNPLE